MPDIISSSKDLISIYLVKVLSLIIIFLIRYNNKGITYIINSNYAYACLKIFTYR